MKEALWRCETCGDTVLVIHGDASSFGTWTCKMSCFNGHEWAEGPGDSFALEVDASRALYLINHGSVVA